MKTLEVEGFFQYEIIITILVSSFWFIWIPVLWVYGHYKYFNSCSAGIAFSRQNLTSTDVRFWRLKSIPALWGLNFISQSNHSYWERNERLNTNICKCSVSNKANLSDFHPLEVVCRGSETQLQVVKNLNYLI